MNVQTQNLSNTLREWHQRGTLLPVDGTASTRIWREGSGSPVILLHGVPASAFLYRKLLPELSAQGFEAIALDFPGMGFAQRPEDFDYSWTGLAGWLQKALDAADINQFHLVVHDIGGPVGFDLVRRIPERILSLTVMNTLVYAASFQKPLVMRPFTLPGIGSLWVRTMDSPMIVPFFRWKGVLSGPTYAELRAYGELLTLGDGGRAFRKVMASFDTTQAFEERILPGLANRQFPAQVIWGEWDTELTLATRGQDVKRALKLETDIYRVNGKHFLQEDSAPEIAERIALLAQQNQDI